MAFNIEGVSSLLGINPIMMAEETTPLLARETVRGVAPYVPAQLAEQIGTTSLAGVSVAEGIGALQFGSIFVTTKNPATDERLYQTDWDLLSGEIARQGRSREQYAEDYITRYGREKTGQGVSPQYQQQSQGSGGVKIKVPSSVASRATSVFGTPIQKINQFVGEYNSMNGDAPIATTANGQISNPYTLGKDLGTLISFTKEQLFKGVTESEAYLKFARTYPSLTYLIENVLEYASYAPKGDILAKVNQYRAVYDGNDMRPANCFYTAEGNVGIRTSNGVQIYTGTRGNTPTIHGYWVGPNSRNDRIPIDILDCIAMCHDDDYDKEGYFSENADYKFIARCMNQMDNMGFVERQVAKYAVHHFLTVGNSVAMFRSNVSPSQDISTQLYGSALSPNQREIFWKGVRDAVDTTFSTALGTNSMTSGILLPMFDDLLIDEVSNFVVEQQPPPTNINIQGTEAPPAPVAPTPAGIESPTDLRPLPTIPEEPVITEPVVAPVPYETPLEAVA